MSAAAGVLMGEGVLAAAVRTGAPLCALQWLVERGALAGAGEDVRRVRQGAARGYTGKWERQGAGGGT